MLINQQLRKDIISAIEDLGIKNPEIVLSLPKQNKFGDYSTNIPLQLSKLNQGEDNQTSIEIANRIKDNLQKVDYLEKIEVVPPGFLNFFIKSKFLTLGVDEIIKEGENYGRNQSGNKQKIQVEFVSANPTGPLTLANGRGGSIGDTLASALSFSDYLVEKEYYVNNTGNQVRILGESIKAAAGLTQPFDEMYKGEYVQDLVKIFETDLDLDSLKLGEKAADYFLENNIKPALARMNITFDRFFSERSLYKEGFVEAVLEKLESVGVVYEKDGAKWFKSTEFGDEKDRVLVTSQQNRGSADATYFLADIAYHNLVFQEGFKKKINLWGADHHGYERRIQSAMEALGWKDQTKIIFMQMVKLFKQGQEVRMSKRTGNFVTLEELLDQVSSDAARYFFLMYSPDSQIDFNLDMATKQSNENPVFYVQYAYARMSNILNKQNFEIFDSSLLIIPEELALIRHLASFPDLILQISQTYEVHKLTIYVYTLADLFHKFYETSRVIGAESKNLEFARLALVKASQITLGNALKLMGIQRLEKM